MSEYEINQEEREAHKQCEFTKVSYDKEGGLITCSQQTVYRVRRYGEKRYLKDGGDAQNPKDYKREQTEADHYLCRKHFEKLYIYSEFQIFEGECPSEFMNGYDYGRYTGKFTFNRL